jgi:hypothetical protein
MRKCTHTHTNVYTAAQRKHTKTHDILTCSSSLSIPCLRTALVAWARNIVPLYDHHVCHQSVEVWFYAAHFTKGILRDRIHQGLLVSNLSHSLTHFHPVSIVGTGRQYTMHSCPQGRQYTMHSCPQCTVAVAYQASATRARIFGAHQRGVPQFWRAQKSTQRR